MADILKIREQAAKVNTLSHEVNMHLARMNNALSDDPSIVFRAAHKKMKRELKEKNQELARLKRELLELHHCYSFILVGDLRQKNGETLENYPLNVEITSVIDCRLGIQTSLNTAIGNHKALWSSLCAKFATCFVNNRFRLGHVTQVR